jgi:hypothetical protein
MHPAPMFFAHFVGTGALMFALWIWLRLELRKPVGNFDAVFVF